MSNNVIIDESLNQELSEFAKIDNIDFKCESVLSILSALNKSGNTKDMSEDFKKKLENGTIGTELIAVVFHKVQNIINNSPHNNKITQEQAAAAFHTIRGLFSVISNN